MNRRNFFSVLGGAVAAFVPKASIPPEHVKAFDKQAGQEGAVWSVWTEPPNSYYHVVVNIQGEEDEPEFYTYLDGTLIT